MQCKMPSKVVHSLLKGSDVPKYKLGLVCSNGQCACKLRLYMHK